MIFLSGYPRSGTTLLANKMNDIEGVFVGPETQYYRKCYKQLANKNKTEFFKVIKNDKRLKDYALTDNEIINICEICNYDRNKFLEVFLDHISTKNPESSVIIEKSPAHVLYWKTIFSLHPSAKLIYLVKDARDVVLSNIKVDWTHSNPFKHSAEWVIYNNEFLKVRKEFPNQILLIKFEDLLINPTEELNKITDFIQVDYSQKKELTINAVPEWELGWKAESMKPIDVTKIYSWKNKPNNENVAIANSICNYSLKNFGFPEENLHVNLKSRLKVLMYKSSLIQRLLLSKRLNE